VLAVIEDLGTYPRWLSVVHRAVPDGEAAWSVDLGARVGPLSRTKRVRMVRVAKPGAVRFERAELDGKRHPEWVLEATVVPQGTGTSVEVHLHYGGAPALPLLDLVLAGEARRAAARLGEVISERAD
jgi:hypothetical protein